ncbi:uncharacterized protein LOC132742944 [Ruditapes philippinarum]|uniref:uncharacterized protein LOC132742944 n=1 Tax=Ruditapes philippinarum TaxID=129788 RepID=UPI00295A84B0|nr:uncharacterized protein LOC132742944 [Ruditapes philippinarum]
MAIAGPDKNYRTWPVNDKFKVSVNKYNPDYTKAEVEFQCFVTTKDNVGIKTEVRSEKTIVHFPVPQDNDSHYRSKLKEAFRKFMLDFVTKDKSYVLISLDDIKCLTKREFCEVILEEFTKLAENQKAKLNHPVKLEFCTMMDRNFGEAVKACEAKIKEFKSEPVVQKNRILLGPSICIVKDSIANVKVDAIACTTSIDFNLSIGLVSSALLKQGGNELQRELNNKCSGAPYYGEVIPVSGHKLDCRVVFFGAMCPYYPDYEKGNKTVEECNRYSIYDLVKRCLNGAEKKQLKSIAFPAIGAGNLKYPLHIVADEMFRAVGEWHGTFVKEVKFVIPPKDTCVLQEFERAEKKYDQSPLFYGSANETGQTWNSRVLTCSINPSAGQTEVDYDISVIFTGTQKSQISGAKISCCLCETSWTNV